MVVFIIVLVNEVTASGGIYNCIVNEVTASGGIYNCIG